MAMLGERLRAKATRAELVSHNTTRIAKLLVEPGANPVEPQNGLPLRQGGIKIEDIARLAPREVYAIEVVRQSTALISNGAGVGRYTAEPTKEPGKAYIDGELISIDEAEKRAGEKYGEDVRKRLEEADATVVVQTRSRVSRKAMFQPYREGIDSVVSSKPSENSA